MGSGWAGLSVHGPGLGWTVGWPARGEHYCRLMLAAVAYWLQAAAYAGRRQAAVGGW